MHTMVGMEIRILVDSLDPPIGVLRPEFAGSDAVEVPFVGWLGLLKALSELLSSVGPDSPDRP